MATPKHTIVDTRHRELRSDEFWRVIPAWKEIDSSTFLDHRWQMKNSINKPKKLVAALQGLASAAFIRDVEEGFRRSPMSVRVSPYLLSLIDWKNPFDDPIRRQFIPLGSQLLPDHPLLTLDSLGEQKDMAVPGLTHRYPDKALFLVLDTCPVYCRFCTRSYAVGINTEAVEKIQLKVNRERWARVFEYLRETKYLEDIVISGGDAYQLKASQLDELADGLFSAPHLRRVRIATKGPAIMPMKLLTDHEWVDALTRMVERGRERGVHVCVHTHFNHPNEVTQISKDALNVLFKRGITVRNQAVLQRGVNDDVDTMRLLVKRLSEINVHPYYVYVHDLVRGVEDLRTTLATAIAVEKGVRGATAGFNTPVFVVDAPGGGGKRDCHSFEYYSRETGVSVYRSPNVDSEAYYYYADPIDLLSEEGQARWADPAQRSQILEEARAAATAVRGVLSQESDVDQDDVPAARFAR
jgi:lysine 2,3-aminomutase